jgi:hypothetical protein
MDWATLTGEKTVYGSIKSWINYGLIDAAGVLAEAEMRIGRRLRVQGMKHITEPFTINEGDKSCDVPAGFRGMVHKGFRIKDIGPVERTAWENVMPCWLDTDEAYVGPPMRYSQFGDDETSGKLVFDLAADQDYSAAMVYWRQPAALSASNTTNLFTKKYPDLLRAMCTAVASEMIRDYDESQQQLLRVEGLINDINIASDMEDSDRE